MTVSYVTLYLPGSSQGMQVAEGSQLHLIYVSMGANSIPSAPGQTVRADPFPQYVDDDELAAALAGVGGGSGGAVDSVNGQTGVVVLDADDLADGTARVLMLPAERTKLTGVAAGATANATDAQLRDRTTHTGTQAISTVTGLQTALDAKAPLTGVEGVKTHDGTTGGGTRPTGYSRIRWIGGTARPTNMVTGDIWEHDA